MTDKPSLIVATLMAPQGWCGVQTHFSAISQYATAAGWDVAIATPHGAQRWQKRPAAAVSRLLDRLHRESAILWNRAAAARQLRGQLKQALDRFKGRDTVIYAQDPLSASAALDLRQQGEKFRLVAVVHFNISEAYENVVSGNTSEGGPLWRNLLATEKRVLPQLDAIIFVSDFMRRTVLARLPEMADVPQQVIFNFPPAVPREGELPPMEGDLLAIGTLEPRKNQSYLLHVLAAARRLGHRYRLTLAGNGPDESQLKQLASQLEIADQVQFAGFVPGASRLLPTHRVLVHAAHMENMPLTLIEAFAHGKAVLAPAVGGIPEVFSDGVEGCLWPLDDPERGAEILINVLNAADGYREKCAAAATRFSECFHPDVLGPRWLQALAN